MLATSARRSTTWLRPSNTAVRASRSTAASPRNGPISAWVRSEPIISAASAAVIGRGRNTTSAIASASTPPTPSITFRPNCGSSTTPAISSRVPRTIGATSSWTGPSAGVDAPSSSAPAWRTCSAVVRLSLTRPRSVLWAMASPHSLTTTDPPIAAAACTASSAVSTRCSAASGTPYWASNAFDAASDRVTPFMARRGRSTGFWPRSCRSWRLPPRTRRTPGSCHGARSNLRRWRRRR